VGWGAPMSSRRFVSLYRKCGPEQGRPDKETEMPRYLISFDDGWMQFPEEDLPAVADAANAVVREAEEAGVWVFGGGLHSHETVSVVDTDGAVTDGPEDKAYIGGFSVVDVPTREDALEWAAKVAVACRCAQEVREFGPGSR
jgi:hypothetical protein